MFKLLRYLKWFEWVAIVLVIALLCGQVWAELELIEQMGNIVELIGQSEFGLVQNADIWNVGLKMFLLVAVITGCAIIVNLLATFVGTRISRTLRQKVFDKVVSFSLEDLSNFQVSSLITRTTNDITQIKHVLTMILRTAFSAPIMAIGAITKIIGSSTTLSLTTLIAIILMLLLVLLMFFIVVPKFKKIQKLTDSLNLVTRENLTGLRVVRAYNAEDFQEDKFENSNKQLNKTTLFVNRISAILMPAMQLIMNLLALAIIWIGAYIIDANPAFLKEMSVFTQYSMQVLMSFLMLSILFVMVPRGSVSAKRVNEVLDTENKILNGSLVKDNGTEKSVEFKNVFFKYPNADDYVLEDISFKVNSGETIAFIGSTGSGKSTLINLIPRFFDASSGEILVNGKNVKEYDIHSLNEKIGYVSQKGVLFSGSIEDNIKYGKENATGQEIEHALSVAQASEFVSKFEDGLNHPISQGGKNVSGGQKQRLSIARAIVKQPEIYIFDDSFSALDYATDKKLREELKNVSKDAIKMIVAQRIGTILDADQIVVLDKGKMVAIGKHEELLKTSEVYREIAYSQLSKEELNG